MTPNLLQIVCLTIVCLAAVIDFRTHKIPNRLTFPGSGLALVLQFIFHGGVYGLIWGICGWLVGVAITLASRFLPLLFRRYKQDAIGFGDVKLVGLVGAYVGPHQILTVFLLFCLFFGAMCVLQIARAVPWLKLWLILQAKAIPQLTSQETERIKTTLRSNIPLAPSIALGTFCAMLLFPSGIK